MRGSRGAAAPSVKPVASVAQTSPSNENKADAADGSKKRKREIIDEANPKLKEFLNVMQTSGRSIHDMVPEVIEERPSKIKAVAVPEHESDDEYENVPSKSERPAPRARQAPTSPPASVPTAVEAVANTESDGDAGMSAVPNEEPETSEAPGSAPVAATDDDWLRSRTNRLLDLVGDDDEIPLRPLPSSEDAVVQNLPALRTEILVADGGDAPKPTSVPVFPNEEMQVDDVEPALKDDALETVHKTARLFVRNLPFSATADDLRTHFDQWGTIEEVSINNYFNFNLGTLVPAHYPLFHDESQIGTAYTKMVFDETPGLVF